MIVKVMWFILCVAMPLTAAEFFWFGLIDIISQRTEGDRFLFLMMTLGVTFVVQMFGWFLMDLMFGRKN